MNVSVHLKTFILKILRNRDIDFTSETSKELETVNHEFKQL